MGAAKIKSRICTIGGKKNKKVVGEKKKHRLYFIYSILFSSIKQIEDITFATLYMASCFL